VEFRLRFYQQTPLGGYWKPEKRILPKIEEFLSNKDSLTLLKSAKASTVWQKFANKNHLSLDGGFYGGGCSLCSNLLF